MALRKAAAYSKKKARPYTRKSSVKAKSYIKAIPPHKIVKMQMGDIQGYERGKYSSILKLVSLERIQVRDNALEASRQFINKILDKNLPKEHYFAIRVFPHHILRENKALTGAGADRMSQGMQQSYGKAMGRAALVASGQDVMLVAVNGDKAVKIARDALNKIKSKLPCKTRVIVEKR
ncbi:MAG: 50S ribosomal protein L16 [archaeon]